MGNEVAVVQCFIYHGAGSYMRRGDVGEEGDVCWEIRRVRCCPVVFHSGVKGEVCNRFFSVIKER